MPLPSNNYKPFLAYISPPDYARLKKFSKTTKLPMTQIVREAISSRMAGGDPYVNGFNDGIKKAMDTVNNMTHAQMRFPSGKSFAELVSDDLMTMLMRDAK
jgi:hypothetical protein